MNIKLMTRMLIGFVCCLLVQFTAPLTSYGASGQSNDQAPPPAVQQSPQELQQLVAPIALYPDALVAQILAASTYPTEIVEADRWMQSHSELKGEQLAGEVDKQPWDPSVKALMQFPSVLANMDKNLSWASSLGEAYANQQQDVMDAVQEMRQQARKAGHLSSNEQEKITNQGNTIVIEPASPDVVYVPEYDPWLVYGYPIVAYPGWYPVPGIFYDGPGLYFGAGFGIGFFGGFGWGWNHWGWDWHDHRMIYNHNTYISHSRTIINRNNFNHGNFNHGNFNHGNFNHGGSDHSNSFHGNGAMTSGSHGSSTPHFQPGTHSGALSGFDHGGNVRGFSSRGQSSFGGGFHGGGGGFHGGGGGGHR
jgi:Protein of unknown function (DUF3300)